MHCFAASIVHNDPWKYSYQRFLGIGSSLTETQILYISSLINHHKTQTFFIQWCHVLTYCKKHHETLSTFKKQGINDLLVILRCWEKLSLVEGLFSKWLQSAKKGVLNLFLSISMAYNVISCQKVAENTQLLKIAKFAM